MKTPLSTILLGDSLEVLKTLDSESVDCVVTSPPYWALRDYGVTGQLGLESTFQEYINKLCDIFDEVKRVLKKEGTCWVNLGDTYNGNKSGYTDTNKNSKVPASSMIRKTTSSSIQEKSLCQIPSRFAIEMSDRGWILRNEIIWKKNNIMPQSVTDRFTVDFEKVFLFSKYQKYHFTQQLEEAVWDIDGTGTIKRKEGQHGGTKSNPTAMRNGVRFTYPNGKNGETHQSAKVIDGMRNKRAVWEINTKPYTGAHFATFPEKLIEPMIKAGCPMGGGRARSVHGRGDHRFSRTEIRKKLARH